MPLRPYWHLAGPYLPRLEQLLPSPPPTTSASPAAGLPGAAGGGRGGEGVGAGRQADTQHQTRHHQEQQAYGGDVAGYTPGSAGSSTCSDSDDEEVQPQQQAAGGSTARPKPSPLQAARLAVAGYLSRVRGRAGVTCAAGLDLLLLQLLCEEQDAEAVEVLVTQLPIPPPRPASQQGPGSSSKRSSPDRKQQQQQQGGVSPLVSPGGAPGVSPGGGTLVSLVQAAAQQQVEGEVREMLTAARVLLEGAGRWHAAALLLAHVGDTAAALEVWQVRPRTCGRMVGIEGQDKVFV